MSDPVISELARCLDQGVPCVMAVLTRVKGSTPRHVGAKMLVLADGATVGTIGGGALESAAIEEAALAMASGEPRLLGYDLRPDLKMMCGGQAEVFLEPYLTPPRLYLFGAGHIGQALCPLAADLGFSVTVIDEREGLATSAAMARVTAWVPGFDVETWGDLPFDERHTYCVVASMDHATDTAVVSGLVERPVAYLGMIGSATKRRTMERTLAAGGADAARLAAIRTPVGLTIGAETPAEIAVSIAAEMVRVRRTGSPDDAPGSVT